MKKCVKILFIFNMILVILLWGIIFFHEKNVEYISRIEQRCELFTDYEVTTYENPDSPIGLTQEYRWTLSDVPLRDGCITFNIVHQEVEVYVGDTLVYSLYSDDNNYLTSTTGYQWAKVFLYASDEGKDIRILINPIYESGLRNHLDIYYGNYHTICSTLVKNDLPMLILGIFAILLGFLIIAFVIFSLRSSEIDKSILMLGFFSIFAGLWKMSDMLSAAIIFPYPIMLSAVAIISMGMMLMPYIYFVRSQCDKSRHFMWNILCILCTLVSILVIVLQLLNILDLRETLILSHGMIIFAIIIVISLLIREVFLIKLTRNLKITFFCCFLCLCGTVLDMVVFYISGYSGNMIFCLLAFTIYVILMGTVSIRDTRALIQLGKEAQHFEELAMHDPLTELYNRAYYSEYISRHNMRQNDCYIIMMDVNNLKLCNDTACHDHGDLLLQNAAKIIRNTFSPNGKCIRMGGDEFCVLLRHISEKQCQQHLKEFDDQLALFNQEHPDEFPVEIAYGYASYDAGTDFDFADTVRRADKMMYQKKHAMKGFVR